MNLAIFLQYRLTQDLARLEHAGKSSEKKILKRMDLANTILTSSVNEAKDAHSRLAGDLVTATRDLWSDYRGIGHVRIEHRKLEERVKKLESAVSVLDELKQKTELLIEENQRVKNANEDLNKANEALNKAIQGLKEALDRRLQQQANEIHARSAGLAREVRAQYKAELQLSAQYRDEVSFMADGIRAMRGEMSALRDEVVLKMEVLDELAQTLVEKQGEELSSNVQAREANANSSSSSSSSVAPLDNNCNSSFLGVFGGGNAEARINISRSSGTSTKDKTSTKRAVRAPGEVLDKFPGLAALCCVGPDGSVSATAMLGSADGSSPATALLFGRGGGGGGNFSSSAQEDASTTHHRRINNNNNNNVKYGNYQEQIFLQQNVRGTAAAGGAPFAEVPGVMVAAGARAHHDVIRAHGVCGGGPTASSFHAAQGRVEWEKAASARLAQCELALQALAESADLGLAMEMQQLALGVNHQMLGAILLGEGGPNNSKTVLGGAPNSLHSGLMSSGSKNGCGGRLLLDPAGLSGTSAVVPIGVPTAAAAAAWKYPVAPPPGSSSSSSTQQWRDDAQQQHGQPFSGGRNRTQRGAGMCINTTSSTSSRAVDTTTVGNNSTIINATPAPTGRMSRVSQKASLPSFAPLGQKKEAHKGSSTGQTSSGVGTGTGTDKPQAMSMTLAAAREQLALASRLSAPGVIEEDETGEGGTTAASNSNTPAPVVQLPLPPPPVDLPENVGTDSLTARRYVTRMRGSELMGVGVIDPVPEDKNTITAPVVPPSVSKDAGGQKATSSSKAGVNNIAKGNISNSKPASVELLLPASTTRAVPPGTATKHQSLSSGLARAAKGTTEVTSTENKTPFSGGTFLFFPGRKCNFRCCEGRYCCRFFRFFEGQQGPAQRVAFRRNCEEG